MDCSGCSRDEPPSPEWVSSDSNQVILVAIEVFLFLSWGSQQTGERRRASAANQPKGLGEGVVIWAPCKANFLGALSWRQTVG